MHTHIHTRTYTQVHYVPGWFAGSLVQGSDSAAPSTVTGRVVWPSPQLVISTASQLSNYHNLPTKQHMDQYTGLTYKDYDSHNSLNFVRNVFFWDTAFNNGI